MNPSSLDPNQDRQLQALFAAPQTELDGEDFVRETRSQLVMADRKRSLIKLSALAGLFTLAALLAVPTGLAQFITITLTSPLLDIGTGWSGWLLMPVNNTGALLILLIKFIRMMTPRSSSQRGSLLPF